MNDENIVIPKMRTIKQVSDATGLSYRYILMLCKQDKIVYIKVGAKYLVNFNEFIKYLNSGGQDKKIG